MRNSLLGSKKGNVQDWFTVIIVLFVSGITCLIAYVVLDAYIDQMDAGGFLGPEAAGAAQGFLWGLRILDYIIILLMIVLIISVAITSYNIATRKVFFIITLIFAAFYGFVSYFFNYVFQEIVSDAAFSSVLGFFPNTILICTNLHWIMLINIIVGSIATYAKQEKGQFLE